MIEIHEMIHKINDQAQYPQPDIYLPHPLRVDLICLLILELYESGLS